MMSYVRKYATALAVLVLSSCNAHAAGPQVPAAGSLTGRVASADGKPLAGVVVSDGVRITQTDTEGMYALDSDKELGYVFISIPSGYMTAADACAIPQFFAHTAKPAGQSERHDFTLTPVDNTRHTVIAATDHHLADRESLDVTQFTAEGGFIDDVKAVAATTASPVYSICMGDMSWDEYWHKRNFMLPEFRSLYERYTFPCPVFNAMGNHDNDPYCASDEAASAAFRREIGPTYYSFNLGQLHYVVLDNIIYVNTGGREGAIGKLDYEVRIDDRQLAWLRADLATVADKAEGGFIDDVKAVAATTASPVYSICMGDMSWDEYWHKRNFMLPEFRSLYERYTFPCPVFNAMGNHDNDPYCASDEAASAAFRREIGPTYYSFNLGQLHYVVLDNIIYVNTGGREGAIGKLDYEVRIDDRQLAWLRADLATVADKSAPLIIVMHAQLHWWYRGSEGVSWKYAFTRGAGCLVDALAGFSEVHLVTGHSHMNFRLLNGNLREHNIAATSGTWWWTGQIHGDYTINTCRDGSPGGYEVFEIDGRDIRWHYKGIGLEDDYQFRAYDMNEVLKNERIRSSGDFTPEGTAGGMNDAYGENDILVNIWGWQPDWTVRVTENGQQLRGVRVIGKDPLHKITYTRSTVPFQTAYNPHMWRYRASGPSTTVRIEVTDSFGRTSSETMTRPKAFHIRMK